MHCIVYKYTYIQAAGGKRITKRHKVCVLTIAGGTGERVAAIRRRNGHRRAAIRHAAGRSTTPTPTTPTRAHLQRISARIWARPRAKAGGSSCSSCSSCWLAGSLARWLDICPLFSTARRGWYSLSARSITPENMPKNKAAGRTVRRRH